MACDALQAEPEPQADAPSRNRLLQRARQNRELNLALHRQFPSSPCAPLIPEQRWFPASEDLRSTACEKLLPPLVADAELEALLDDLESDRAERKEAWAGDVPEKAGQVICALANDLPNHQKAGVLFVGVDDKGIPKNISVTDQLLLTLADIKSNGNLLPPPTMTVGKRSLKGSEVAVVTAWPADAPPVRFKGRIWIRTGPRRGIASAQDERILNEKQRHRDMPFDISPRPSAQLADLNRLFCGD